jgi:hypothetical protein
MPITTGALAMGTAISEQTHSVRHTGLDFGAESRRPKKSVSSERETSKPRAISSPQSPASMEKPFATPLGSFRRRGRDWLVSPVMEDLGAAIRAICVGTLEFLHQPIHLHVL